MSSSDDSPAGSDGGSDRDKAINSVKGPAISLIVIGGMSGMWHSVSVAGEPVPSVMDTEMPGMAEINQPVAASPAIAADDALDGDLSPDDPLQCVLPAVRDDFGADTRLEHRL